MIFLADYKKMYHTMFRASEEAINLLIAAQLECERLYLAGEEPTLQMAVFTEQKKSMEEPK